MQRLSPPSLTRAHALYDCAVTRQIEQAAFPTLPPHTLMQRAGRAVAQLALALAPHARHLWLACGPGNNGGDGLEAAVHLHQAGKALTVTWLGDEARLPDDARAALQRARAAGVPFSAEPPPSWDLCIDALLGLGAHTAPRGRMADWIVRMNHSPAPVLAVDLPSGLNADTGHGAMPLDASSPVTSNSIANHADALCVQAQFTLSLLSLKPGLFTAHGRDCAGEVWLDTLGLDPATFGISPSAWLSGAPAPAARPHAAHKGSFGDVAVLGGTTGMTGAAVLAAAAALHAGAGRVWVGLLSDTGPAFDPQQAELMFRSPQALDLSALTVVCGCGGGEAVSEWLPQVLAQAPSLVLDADALNQIARDSRLHARLQQRAAAGQATVLTPHPLEAARLLGLRTPEVQAHRLQAAQRLADQFRCTVVLKGSGTVIATPGQLPCINPTGNSRLATAGTGDVLAGMVGAALARGLTAAQAAAWAVYQHGATADQWPAHQALTAGRLARAIQP